MTNEEIEEQAEEYTKEKHCKNGCKNIPNCWENDIEDCCTDCIKTNEDFIAGAKWGIANANEWHDLRENPNDLPKCEEKQQIIFYVKEYNTDIEKDTSHFCLGFYAKSFMNDDIKVFVERSKGYECEHLSQEVIKWYELPKVKE